MYSKKSKHFFQTVHRFVWSVYPITTNKRPTMMMITVNHRSIFGALVTPSRNANRGSRNDETEDANDGDDYAARANLYRKSTG